MVKNMPAMWEMWVQYLGQDLPNGNYVDMQGKKMCKVMIEFGQLC